MANKAIPMKDKELIVQRLAQGLSTRQAIRGTAIASNSTAALIGKRQSHAIEQYRRKYLYAIEHISGATQTERARMWGAMIYANKPAITNYYIDEDPVTGKRQKVPIIDTLPDWRARERALRHIDALEESLITKVGTDQKVQVNLIKDSSDFQISNS